MTVAFEFQPQGAAMVIVNDSERAVTLNPKDIKVITDDGSISPCTLHMLSMFGMGAPAMDVTVKPGGRDGYMLDSCAPLCSMLVVDEAKGVELPQL